MNFSLKATCDKDVNVSILFYMKLIDLSVEFIKIDNHLERNIDEFKKHVKSFENKNDKISYENNVLRRETLKSNRCEK